MSHPIKHWEQISIVLISLVMISAILIGSNWLNPEVQSANISSASRRISTYGEIKAPITNQSMSGLHYVVGDRVFDENGKEVIWRSAGVSYLLGSSNYASAWQETLPELKALGVNTVRLGFHFPVDVGSDTDLLDYAKLDWVLNFLAQNNIKAILDNHPASKSTVRSFGTEAIINAWKSLASRYRGDTRIAAYELYNEPYNLRWAPSVTSTMDVAEYYANLTKEVRKVDPDHIVIWQAGNPNAYLPPFEKWYTQYGQPNVVYSFHAWWQQETKAWQFKVWSFEQISDKMIDPIVYTRAKWKVPFWLGESGTLEWQYDAANPTWALTEQNLWRCEEQLVGWCLWEGGSSLSQYQPLFPLKHFNSQMMRQPWPPTTPHLPDYITASGGMDNQGEISAELLHNYDSITIAAGIQIQKITTQKQADGSVTLYENKIITVNSPLTIKNPDGPKYDIYLGVV